jgi:hypothetical protein
LLAHRQGAAWRQAVIVIVSVALVVAAVTYCAVRPFDRDTLAIRVAQLRSQAAEAAMAARLANADRLAPGFAHAHAGQLLRKVESVDGELRVHPDGGMTARYRDATADASALSATIQRAPPSREPGTGGWWRSWPGCSSSPAGSCRGARCAGIRRSRAPRDGSWRR